MVDRPVEAPAQGVWQSNVLLWYVTSVGATSLRDNSFHLVVKFGVEGYQNHDG